MLYDIDREAAKLLALSLVKIDKYKYLPDKEIFLSDQSRTSKDIEFKGFVNIYKKAQQNHILFW